jgi:hypothetical protein
MPLIDYFIVNGQQEVVTRQDYKEDMRDIKDMLNKIFDRLESKQDK